MLEAYLTDKSLKVLNAQLPEEVVHVKQELTSLLEEAPLNTRALFMLARCHLLCDETSEAKRTLQVLLENAPEHVSAKVELAKVFFGEENPKEAITLLTEVTNARPEIIENWRLLSEIFQQGEQTEASQNALKQYDMIKAFNDKLQIAEKAFASADFRTADTICRELLQLVPNEVRTLRLLARIARQFGHFEFSTATLARCVETRPADMSLGLDYAYSLLSSRRYQDALVQCQKIIELTPENIDTQDLMAEVLYNLSRYDEAIEIYRELAELTENRELSLLHLGKVLKIVGKADEATTCFLQAIEIKPELGQAYWELADLKTYRFSDDEITSMRSVLEDGDVSALNKVLIEFALGKGLEDAQQFSDSFQYYQSANSAYMKLRPSRYSSQNDRFKSFFTSDYFSARKDYGSDSKAPIFVVGLPRSGSTLLEQILSSHSQVDATQELDEIVSIARAVNDPAQPEQGQYPRSLANMSADQIENLAERYLEYVRPYRQHAPRFVDKAPHNFHHIGLIKTLFPNAGIIDIRRNPMASGWSLYRQFFDDSFHFSYDLETIGKYHNDYIELMNHWHTVLPGQILTVNYEDLVNEFPATVDSILQYCGLAFEDACLSFHLNERAVATPSSEQVRQPLYTDALEHWKNYEEFLTPLKQALENHDDSPAI